MKYKFLSSERDLINVNDIFGKNVTYNDIKSD